MKARNRGKMKTKRKPSAEEQVEDFVPDYDYVVELLKQREKKDDGIQ